MYSAPHSSVPAMLPTDTSTVRRCRRDVDSMLSGRPARARRLRFAAAAASMMLPATLYITWKITTSPNRMNGMPKSFPARVVGTTSP